MKTWWQAALIILGGLFTFFVDWVSGKSKAKQDAQVFEEKQNKEEQRQATTIPNEVADQNVQIQKQKQAAEEWLKNFK